MSRNSFDDFLSVVESGSTKTASLTSRADGNILAKLAQELEGVGAAPTAEGQVTPAASMIAGANPGVVGATEGVAGPQVAMAGGNLAVAAAGEMPAPSKPFGGLGISAGDGTVKTVDQLGKTPAAVVAGAAGVNGETKTAEQKQAESIGQMIADSFLESLVKQAEQGQYQESLYLLKCAGLLDGYDIVDDTMSKTASEEGYPALTKIANNLPLTRDDIIKAAEELKEKMEEDEEDEEEEKEEEKKAEQYGRELAWEYMEELEKEAELVEADARLAAREYAIELQKEALEEEAYEVALQKEAADDTAMYSLMQDRDVVNAVSVLKSRGLI